MKSDSVQIAIIELFAIKESNEADERNWLNTQKKQQR